MGATTNSKELPRTSYLRRLAALKNERATWESHWRECNDYLLPRRARFNSTDRNKGSKVNTNIINGTPIRATRVLSAGMMAGITSPARPWFRLTTPDPNLAQVEGVRAWLHAVEESIRMQLARSNIYNVLPSLYQDLGVFGTAVAIIDEDEEDGLRSYAIPIGSYYLANSYRMQVDTLFRELSMTAAQLVERFGEEQCSQQVRDAFNKGNRDQWFQVVHVIEPNTGRDTDRKDYKGKKFRSCWFEWSRTDDNSSNKGFLRESGYDDFPVLAPRWDVTGEDVYGRSPGMDALGDAKALQLLERRKAMLVDKMANPPMKAPTTLFTRGRASLLPGDVTYVDAVSGGTHFEPAMVVDPRSIQLVGGEVKETENRINAAFFADLWLMMADSDRRQITATEVNERHEEKMLQLGPVLERLQDELLDPLIDRVFNILLARGEIPPPPQELAGVELRVDYISIMAQAQKMLGTAAVERLASFVGNLAAAKPDVLDKLNSDELVDEYAAMLGTKPDLVNSDEEVAAMRQQRAQQQQMAQQTQMALQGAQGAKLLSETDTGGDNALSRLMGTVGQGAGLPQ